MLYLSRNSVVAQKKASNSLIAIRQLEEKQFVDSPANRHCDPRGTKREAIC